MTKFRNEVLNQAVEVAEKLNLSHLQELQTVISELISKREVESKREAMTQIRNIAAAAGIPLAEILKGAPEGKIPRKSSGAAPVKYRHPEKPELQWTGRGRHPQWVKEWEQQYGDVDKLLVS